MQFLRVEVTLGKEDDSDQIPCDPCGQRGGAAGRLAAQGEECCPEADASENSTEGGGGMPRQRNHGGLGNFCRHGRQDPAKMCLGRRRCGIGGSTATGSRAQAGRKAVRHVIAIARTPAAEGHDHWTLRLLADQVVQLGFSSTFSHEAVRQP